MGWASSCEGWVFAHESWKTISSLPWDMKNRPKNSSSCKKKIYTHIGTLFLEIARNFTLTRQNYIDELQVSDEDLAKINKIHADGRGMLVISAHTGNWEIFPASMAARGYSVAIVAKKMSNPISQTLIEQRRVTTGFSVIYTGNTLNKIAESMTRGCFVGCMVDQHLPGPRGLRVNFFGTPAASIRGLANLARDTKCRVVPMAVYRQENGAHRLIVMDELQYIEAKELPEGSPERLLREEWLNTQKYQECLEFMIRQNLSQWLWIHRRWKANRSPLNLATAHLEQNI
jgi:Kdo2-lipid IVA lauroyltransferase/acyltransferase